MAYTIKTEVIKEYIENHSTKINDTIEIDENEYQKYDIDLLDVRPDAKFIIHQLDNKPDLKIDSIGETIDGDIIMFVKEIEV